MAIHAATSSHPVDIRRARFSWHFHTPGRRRWLLVQFVSGPCDHTPDDEQNAPTHAPAHPEVRSQTGLLDSYTDEMWRRRSF